MIECFPPLPESQETRLVLRPNQAASVRQLAAFFALLASACGGVAVLSFTQGNVFAPGFALLDLLLVAACLRWVWRRGGRAEVIAVSPDSIAVRRLPELADAFMAHPRWVQVERGDGAVRLRCAGREVEIGSFLGSAERERLADSVGALLAAAASGGRRVSTDNLG